MTKVVVFNSSLYTLLVQSSVQSNNIFEFISKPQKTPFCIANKKIERDGKYEIEKFPGIVKALSYYTATQH